MKNKKIKEWIMEAGFVLVGNLIEMMKLPLATAINAATINPAKRMGFARKGLIEAGYDADLCVLNYDYSVAQTWVLGEAMLLE